MRTTRTGTRTTTFHITVNGEQRPVPAWVGVPAVLVLVAVGPGLWLLGVVAAVWLAAGGLR